MGAIEKGTKIEHYACGNLISAEVVFAGGKKIITRHEPQTPISGQERNLTIIEWSKERKKPLPLAYFEDQVLTEKHFT